MGIKRIRVSASMIENILTTGYEPDKIKIKEGLNGNERFFHADCVEYSNPKMLRLWFDDVTTPVGEVKDIDIVIMKEA